MKFRFNQNSSKYRKFDPKDFEYNMYAVFIYTYGIEIALLASKEAYNYLHTYRWVTCWALAWYSISITRGKIGNDNRIQ